MPTSIKQFICALTALLTAASVSPAQEAHAVSSEPVKTAAVSPAKEARPASSEAEKTTASIAPPSVPRSSELAPITLAQASPAAPQPAPIVVAQSTAAAPSTPATVPTAPATTTTNSITENGGVGVREFQGDDVGQVLRLLARQAKINMVVSEAVTGTVTMRLEDVTALQAVAIIVKAKGLFMDQIDNIYYIKTGAERTAEPTESDSYQFSYGRAKDIAPLLASQLSSKEAPQVDERTNTIFFRETRSNIDNIRKLLVQIDKPTKQVMIEARLVEVNANPKQSYGINWAGVVGSSTAPQTVKYGGIGTTTQTTTIDPTGIPTTDLAKTAHSWFGNLVAGQFAILSVPQMSLTLRALNEDADAEFLANPRVVTADNQQAKIEIIRNQPVPQLNFNEQTATAVFGGFQDKKFGNTLVVRPSVNKDDFVTLMVKPEISNKVADATFVFAGATVASPIIDTRTLDSNVLIKSGDTLAIGGLLQDEVTKARNKVPIMGDIPILGYFFQERLNARTKRNLLVFVTPTILAQRYGTGLEDQVSGLNHSGEEYADPNGWRNNAKGAVRLVPTSNRQIATDYPKPGVAPAPTKLRFMTTAKDRDF
jgi:type IV pilus secretin PilQ/predicted competence protein